MMSKASGPSVGILTTDAQLVIRTWDDWLAQITGLSTTDARGRPLASVAPELESGPWRARFDQVLLEGAMQIMAPALHHYLIPCPARRPGKFFSLMQQRVTIAPLREKDKIVGTLITIEDVTDRQERERELAEQLASADEITRLRAVQELDADQSEGAGMLLFGALRDESWRVRRAAVDRLALRGNPETITALVHALREEHQNPAILNSALQVLSMSGWDTFSPLLNLIDSPDVELRIYAVLALGEQRDPRSIAPLMEKLQDPDSNVRYHVIEALGKLQATEAVDALVTIAQSRDFATAYPAIEALIEIGDPRAAAPLVPLLEDETLCTAVAELEARLGQVSVVGPLTLALNTHPAAARELALALAAQYERAMGLYHNQDQVADTVRAAIKPSGLQSLMDALGQANSDQLRAIALILGWIQDPATESALTRLLGQPAAPQQVVNALARHPHMIEFLVQAVDSPDLETRRSAAITLGRMGDARAVPALIRLLTADADARIMAVAALAKIGDRRAYEPLIACMGDPNAAVRQAVISALNSLAHPEMSTRMANLMRDQDPRVRESAVRVAGYFGYPECVQGLLDLTHDPIESVRRAAIENIGFLEDDRAMGVLADALKNDVAAVRAAAARALAHADCEDRRALLLTALADADSWVRYFAARSLGQCRITEALPILVERARTDPASPVRIAAIQALAQIGGKEIHTVLEPLTHSDDADIARAAAGALDEIEQTGAFPP